MTKHTGFSKGKKWGMFFIAVLFTCLFFPERSYAYIDPGTGSYVIQLLLAAVVGGLFALKIFWKNVKTFFKNLFQGGKKPENTSGE